MFAATYKRWSFTWGSNLRNLIGKILVFWKGGFLWEVLLAKGGRKWSKPRNHVNHIKMSLKHAKFSINWNNTLFMEYWYLHADTVNLTACIYRAVFLYRVVQLSLFQMKVTCQNMLRQTRQKQKASNHWHLHCNVTNISFYYYNTP